MKCLLLLWAVTGFCCGLQAPLLYKYKYFGSIGTGIPEINSQQAGWAMKAEVEVYVEEDGVTAVFQLYDVKMAEYNVDLGCDVRQDIPEELFHRFKNESLNQALEQPFKAHLFNYTDYTIEHSGDYYKLLVNLRKGIAAIFKNEILKENFVNEVGKTSRRLPNVFSHQEDTMIGRCLTEYTFYPITKHLAGTKNNELQNRMEEDVQRDHADAVSGTSKKASIKRSFKSSKKSGRGKSLKTSQMYTSNLPELKEDLWHVVRSVNFDNCEERVDIQISPVVGVLGDFNIGQYEWVRGRSSVSEYIFRGSPGHMRLESATVEGATLMAPLGLKTELIQARTNQTIHLVSVTTKKSAATMPSNLKQSKTWMHELWSFAPPPNISAPHEWITYTEKLEEFNYFGSLGLEPLSAEVKEEIKTTIIDNVKRVSLYLTDLDQKEQPMRSGEVLEYITKTVFLFKHLNKTEVLEIFDLIFKENPLQHEIMAKKLVVDIAAATAGYFANSAILEYIRKDQLSHFQIMTYFMTLINSADHPLSVPELMDYVLSLDIHETPFLTSTVLVNYANYFGQLCVYPYARKYIFPGQFLGDMGCEKKLIKEKFLPYLKNIIYNEDTTWEKNVALVALRLLGTPFSFPIVADVIKGKVGCSTKARVQAIYVLDPNKLGVYDSIRDQIFDLLTEVYSNVGEKPEVREAALETIVFWKPETSFWHRLARTTWKEPSKYFAIFTSSVIQSFAARDDPQLTKEIQAASFALQLAKPVMPCKKYSYFSDWTSRKLDRHLYMYRALSSHHSFSPEDSVSIFFEALNNFGGFEISFMKLYASVTLRKPAWGDGKDDFTGIPQKMVQDVFDKIQDTLNIKEVDRGHHFSLEILLKLFDSMTIYLSSPPKGLQDFQNTLAKMMGTLVAQLAMGYDLVLGKFIAPINANSFLASELGIGLSVSSTVNFLASYVSSLNLDANQEMANMKLSVNELTRFTSFSNSLIFAMLPWSANHPVTGVTGSREITVPLAGVMRNEVHEPDLPASYHLDLQSLYKNKFSLVSATTSPYIGFVPLITLNSPPPDVKLIKNGALKYNAFPLPESYTGLDLQITWLSENPFPLNLWNVMDLIGNPSLWADSWYPWIFYSKDTPSVQFWAANLDFNPETSKTKNISFDFSFGVYGKQRENITQFTQELNGEGQYDQDVSGQYEEESVDTQQSVDADQGFQEIGETDENETKHRISYDDSQKQRSEKLQRFFGGPVSTINLKIHLEGNENRSYEIGYFYTRTKINNDRKMKKSHISLIRSPIPGIDDKSSSICLDIQKRTPAFSQLDTVDTFLAKNLTKEIEAELTLGCTGQPVATLKGTSQLSDEGKLKLQNNSQECNYDPYNPLFSLRSNAIYDDSTYTLTWEKVCDTEKCPVTSKLFGIAGTLMDVALLKDTCSHLEKEREIEVHIHRCQVSGNWFIDFGNKDSKLHLNDVPHNDFFNFFFSIWRIDHLFDSDDESEQCVLGIDSVRTFDGFVYEYSPTECWTVAAKDCSRKEGPMLLIRSSSGESVLPDAKYIDVEKGFIIEYSDQEIKVNGKVIVITGDHEVIKNEKGEILFVIFRKNDFYMMRFLRDFFISFKDKIRIHVPSDKRGGMCGLCGNYDAEPESELVGPHRCFYDDPKLFATAWAAESDTCDLYTLSGLRENAEKFQDTCHAIDSLLESCPYYNDRCTKFGWMIKEIESELCVSSLPLPYCGEDCNWTESRCEKVVFNCWPPEHAPEAIKNAGNETAVYITTPLHYDPYYQKKVYLSFATLCKKL